MMTSISLSNECSDVNKAMVCYSHDSNEKERTINELIVEKESRITIRPEKLPKLLSGNEIKN